MVPISGAELTCIELANLQMVGNLFQVGDCVTAQEKLIALAEASRTT